MTKDELKSKLEEGALAIEAFLAGPAAALSVAEEAELRVHARRLWNGPVCCRLGGRRRSKEVAKVESRDADPTHLLLEFGCRLGLAPEQPGLLLLAQPVATAPDVDGGGVMEQAIQDGRREEAGSSRVSGR